MMAMEARLRRISGVADLALELGEQGLTGITVRVHPGVDEGEVLEEIRRVLVTYGLSSRRAAASVVPRIDPSEERSSMEGSQPPAEGQRVTVEPHEGGLRVLVERGGRRAEAVGEATPDGAAWAMGRVIAELWGLPSPSRCAARRVTVGDDPVVVVVTRLGERAAAGAALVSKSSEEALFEAVWSALQGVISPASG